MAKKETTGIDGMNPWLVDRIRILHAILTDDELQSLYNEMYGDTKEIGWNDFICLMAIRYSLTPYPFLTLHRVDMELPQDVREWLYWNNVDTALDLVQISDEELRIIATGYDGYYDIITKYLAAHEVTLLHSDKRTFKVSGFSILSKCPAKLVKWKIRNPGTTHVFNPARPTVLPEWFDEFYRRYEFIKDEDKYCKRLVPLWAGIQKKDISEIDEFFKSLREVWKAYRKLCDKCHITPRLQQYSIPENSQELDNFPLNRFIDLKKDALRAIIDFFDQTGVLFYCPLGEYIEQTDHYKELDIADLEKDEELKSFMFMHVSMQIDFDNIVWYMNLFFNFKNRPIPEWPYNPWLREKVLEYRSSFSDADLHSQYDRYMDSHPVATWMDFMFQAALGHAVSKNPALLTPLEQMDIERDVREELWLTDVRVLGDLVQLTKEELNLLFDDNPSKISQIDRCLKKHGLHIYTSNLLTCKIPVISTKMSNFAVN